MTKQAALQYVVDHPGCTAKMFSIDTDAPISTSTEMLERLAKQQLVERDRDQRPREYAITEEGRKRLEFFKARDAAVLPPGEPNLNGNAGASASGVAPSNPASNGAGSTEKLDALREEVCSRLDALREDLRDLLDVLAAKPSSDAPAPSETGSSRLDDLVKRVERLKAESEEPDQEPEVPDLEVADYYAACRDLKNAPLLSFDNPSRRRKVAELEAEMPPEVVLSVKRLIELEGFRFPLSLEEKQEVAGLRDFLGLEASPEVSGG